MELLDECFLEGFMVSSFAVWTCWRICLLIRVSAVYSVHVGCMVVLDGTSQHRQDGPPGRRCS